VGIIQDFGFGHGCSRGGEAGRHYMRGGGTGGGGTRLLAWRRVARRGCVWSAAMVACCWLEEGDDLVMWASWAKHAKVV
jgi:hypothetical protein